MKNKLAVFLLSFLSWSQLIAVEQDGLIDVIEWDADSKLTQEELILLQLSNRFRSDPQAEIERILPTGKRIRIPGLSHEIDWEMFRSELRVLEPQEPVIPDPILIRTARSHASYLAKHNLVGHVQSHGSEGFVGVSPIQRAQHFGWKRGIIGENVTGAAYGAVNAHRGYVIDWDRPDGSGAGGMQEPRGHRNTMMSPAFHLVGMAMVSSPQYPGRWFSCQVFGGLSQGPGRLAGIAFADLDRNELLGPGEALSGEVVLLDQGREELARVSIGSQGLWVMPHIPGAKSIQVDLLNEKNLELTVDESQRMQWFDTPVLSQAQRQELEDALFKMEAMQERNTKRIGKNELKAARAELWLSAYGLHLPMALQQRYNSLMEVVPTQDIVADMESALANLNAEN